MNNKVGDFSKSVGVGKFQNFVSKGRKNKTKAMLGPDYKLNLSDKSKMLKEDIDKKSSKANSSQSSISSSISLPSIPIPSIPSIPDIKITKVVEEKNDLDTAKKVVDEVSKIQKKPEQKIKKPAVFFIGSMKLFGSVGDAIFKDGMKTMADSIDEAKYFEWNQKDEMLEQIKKRTPDQKVILVGHGFGSDTAVEVAQELNSVENRFRSIDLLVTLNSSGLNNDFIPQNVVKNLNFLTSDNGITDDGPNIAINYERTKVFNYLRPESHSDLDDSTDVQIEIMDEINKLI